MSLELGEGVSLELGEGVSLELGEGVSLELGEGVRSVGRFVLFPDRSCT